MNLKYIVKIIVITFMIIGINNSFAEDKVVFVDMNRILNESKVGKFVESELTKNHEDKLESFKTIEEKLKKDEIDLISKRNIMAREEFDKKVKLLNDQAQEYQTERRKWFDNITSKRNAARAEVLKALDQNKKGILTSNGINVYSNDKKTVYIMLGDWIAYICIIVSSCLVLKGFYNLRKKQ